jgi:hypothetical protein
VISELQTQSSDRIPAGERDADLQDVSGPPGARGSPPGKVSATGNGGRANRPATRCASYATSDDGHKWHSSLAKPCEITGHGVAGYVHALRQSGFLRVESHWSI